MKTAEAEKEIGRERGKRKKKRENAGYMRKVRKKR